MRPMNEVGAGGVPPVLGAFVESVGIRLVPEVIEPTEIPDAVHVVQPAHRGGEVHLTAVGLVVIGQDVGIVRAGTPERARIVSGIGRSTVDGTATST